MGLPHHHGVGVGGLAGGDHGGLVEDGGDGGHGGHFDWVGVVRAGMSEQRTRSLVINETREKTRSAREAENDERADDGLGPTNFRRFEEMFFSRC